MKTAKPTSQDVPTLHPRYEEEVIAAVGAVAGASVGALAGPAGVAAGTVIGAAVGMTIGRTLEREDERRHLRDEALDLEIGVAGGDMGSAASTRISRGEVDEIRPDDEKLLESLDVQGSGDGAASAPARTTCAASPVTAAQPVGRRTR